MPKKFNGHLCQKVAFGCLGASVAPRLENPDADEKDALFGLDTQITIPENLRIPDFSTFPALYYHASSIFFCFSQL
jgi:hypothetical protein